MKSLVITFSLLVLWTISGYTQTTIQGKVVEEDTGEELIGANVIFFQNGIYITGISTDFDGNYKVTIDTGTYEVETSYIGMASSKITGVVVRKNENNKLDISLKENNYLCTGGCGGVWEYRVPLIEISNPSTRQVVDREDIKNLPVKNLVDIISNVPGISIH